MEKGPIFTYLLTYGGAVASFFDPFIGLLIYICFSIIKPEAMWYWSVPAGNYSRIVAVCLLIGWALRGFGNWNFGKSKWIILSLLGFWGWSFLSMLQANNYQAASEWFEALSKIVLPFLVGVTIATDLRKLRLLVWVIVLSQGYVAYELNLTYYNGFNRVWEEGYAGMDNNSVAIAMCTCVGIAFFLGLQESNKILKLICFGAALVMAHVIMFAFSRGGLVGLILTGVVGFVLIPKTAKHYLIFLAAVLMGYQLAGKQVTERFLTSFAGEEERDASAGSRLELWKNCIDSMQKRPIFGVGPGSWGDYAPEYGWIQGKQAHTVWLQIGAEVGIPGLALLLTFFALTVVYMWPLAKARAGHEDPWLGGLARMVISSIIGFAVSAQFVSLSLLETPYYVVLIGVGVLQISSAGSAGSVDLSNHLRAGQSPQVGE